MSNAVSSWIAIKLVELLSKPFTEWDAYQLGLIDEDGRKIKEPRSREEKEQFRSWMNLVRNLKRLLQTIPGGRRKVSSYAAAFILLKEAVEKEESVKLNTEEIEFLVEHFSRAVGANVDLSLCQERYTGAPDPGSYRVVGASGLLDHEFRDSGVVEISECCTIIATESGREIIKTLDSNGKIDIFPLDCLIPVPELNTTAHIAAKPIPLGRKRRKDVRDAK